ncbi:MAG: DUF1499 domain-containing protein [Oleispira antarctica]|nr:DUF1499 domain-containing protein [Oleispira antarctica]MBQ0792950.1 DUF1499 domain-containing protein [Oleispira antarctica]|tara:strand:- start:2813 stop:3277 length:465 start_codon:yes stop_codon:yes gene_type:complete
MRILTRLSFILPLIVVSSSLIGCAGQMPSDLGITNGSELRPCPDKPNCVQTYDPLDTSHFQPPLTAKQSDNQTRLAITTAINETGGKIISANSLQPMGYYLHAEYESDWLKFVDDVEVVIQDGLIHIRSASRLGHSDLGVNAERLEKIKAVYSK